MKDLIVKLLSKAIPERKPQKVKYVVALDRADDDTMEGIELMIAIVLIIALCFAIGYFGWHVAVYVWKGLLNVLGVGI